MFTGFVDLRQFEACDIEDWVYAPVRWDVENKCILTGRLQDRKRTDVWMLKLSRGDVVVGSGIDIGVADWQQTGVQEYRIAYLKRVRLAMLVRCQHHCQLGFFQSLSKHL